MSRSKFESWAGNKKHRKFSQVAWIAIRYLITLDHDVFLPEIFQIRFSLIQDCTAVQKPKNHLKKMYSKFMGPCIVNIFQLISKKMHLYTVYLYMEIALHVSGGTSTHHQERIQLYLQHLVFITPLLLPAAIAAGSNNGMTNTRSCRYSCMRSWWWVEVPPETCRAISIQK